MSGPGWWASPGSATARARTWTTRGAVNGCVAAGLALATAAVCLYGTGGSGRPVAQAWGTQVPANLAAMRAGCGPTSLVSNPSSVVGTVDVPGALPYDTTPGVAGWFAQAPAGPDDLDATTEQVVAALWAGQRAVWVASDATARDVAAVRSVVAAHPQWGAVVHRWPAGRGEQIAAGVVALASWGAVQVCGKLDDEAATQFFATAPPAPGRDGSTPPVAFVRAADEA